MTLPKSYALMLKMDGCGHCINTLAVVEKVYKKHRDLPAFFAETSEDLANTEPFLKRAKDIAALADVSGFPTLFFIKNGVIVNSVVGGQDEEGLLSFLRT